MSNPLCTPDSSGAAWFQCAYGTVGCPKIHNTERGNLTPHCIACQAGSPCPYSHTPPAVEMTAEEYYELKREEVHAN